MCPFLGWCIGEGVEAPRPGAATKAPDITVATIKEVDSEGDGVVDSEEDPLGEGSVDFAVDSFRYRNGFLKQVSVAVLSHGAE